jgi:carbohydrate-binding DOMON domain-containing protein
MTQTATSYVTQTKEVYVEKPYVDPVSYAVLGLGVIAGLAGVLVAARRK